MTPYPRSPSQLVNPLARQRMMGYGTAAGGEVVYAGPLDAYATSLWEAWGFARLLSSYTGSLAQVRETGGSTSANIGFGSTGLLDTAALASHVGSNSGFVATLYGQANSRPLLQATTGAQPRIVNAGTNVTIGSSGAACMQVVADHTQRMVTAGVTAYTGVPLTMLAVHVGLDATINTGRGPLNILDSSNRSDGADTLACFTGNGSRGITLVKGDYLNSIPGTSGVKTRVLVGVFDGVNKTLYDSVDMPGSSLSNAETTAFNFDRVGMWSFTANAGWSIVGEKWAAGAVWTRALSSAEVYALTASLKTLFNFS
jgi:hypothetical protein